MNGSMYRDPQLLFLYNGIDRLTYLASLKSGSFIERLSSSSQRAFVWFTIDHVLLLPLCKKQDHGDASTVRIAV